MLVFRAPMIESKTISPTVPAQLPAPNASSAVSPSTTANTRKQQRLMAAALILLIVTLTVVLYHDRDFWFPEEAQTQDDGEQTAPTTAVASSDQPKQSSAKAHSEKQTRSGVAAAQPAEVSDEARPPITVTRTVLPPLEVEVIAGNSSRKLRPGSNTVQVDLERGSAAPRATPSVPVNAEPVPATVTSKAAEHVQVSRNTANLITHSVTPNYPTLARQMKVQGSVVLQAIIGRDGLIQDLQIVSGPPILAGAAREAVKQWHFKPHYLGSDPVETQAKITVNFSISTN